MTVLQKTIAEIKPVHQEVATAAAAHWDGLVKPIGSLGRLEEMVVQLAAIRGEVPRTLRKRALVVFAADNGVVVEGVASAPQEVTAIQAENFIKGIGTISVFCRSVQADLTVIDIGINSKRKIPGVLDRRVAAGTQNLAHGAAMSEAECLQAVEVGIQIAHDLAEQGYDILLGGEMGIGNTTSSSCIAAGLLGGEIEPYVGKGAGLSDEGLHHKIEVIKRALHVNRIDEAEPLQILARVGGFDIAGLVGFYLGAAASGVPVVIDGFIAATAALVATLLAPAVRPYLLASHSSAEPGFRAVMEELKLQPVLNLRMRLGEGTGAALLLPLLDTALQAYWQTGTLSGSNIDQETLVDIRK